MMYIYDICLQCCHHHLMNKNLKNLDNSRMQMCRAYT
uniref:Uncharacterized protein n=1 Tax=Rhizophora mucronata TaxID=61149 RepID=A0A2P2QCB4_RHIMU